MGTSKPATETFRLDEEVLKISRICLTVFFTFISFGLLSSVEELGLYDPPWARILHSSLTFIVLILTFFSEMVRKKIQKIMLFFFYTMSAHSLLLLYWNSLYIGYLVGMILVITCIGVSFVERKWLRHYLGFVVTAGILVGIYTEKPQVDLSLYLSAILTPAIVSYLTLNIRLNSIEKLRESQVQLKLFHDRIRTDLQLASETQNNLVTRVWPKSKNYKCSSFFRAYEGVGGDAISFIQRPDGKTVFFFADVSGHGIASAMVSAMAVLAFKIHALEENDPASCLKAMHNGLKNLVNTNHISACVVYFLPEEKKIIYSYAGHPPILLLKPSEEAQFLEGKGTLIVSLLEPKLRNYHRELDSGEKILFYSDGVIEIFNESDEIYGDHSLLKILSSLGEKKGEDILNAIYSDISSFSNGIFNDDISMLLLEIE